MGRLYRSLKLLCFAVIIVLMWSELAQGKIQENLQRAILANQSTQEESRGEIVRGELAELKALGSQLKAAEERANTQAIELRLLRSHVANLELSNKIQARMIYEMLSPTEKGFINEPNSSRSYRINGHSIR